MDEQRLERIIERPGACTMDNVTWLCQLVIQLQADYAEAIARAIKAEEEIERLTHSLETFNYKLAAWSRRVLPG